MFLFQDWVSRRAATSAAKMSTWLTDSFLSCLRCNHPRPPSLWSCCPWTKWQIKLNLCLPALSGNNMKAEKKRLSLTPRDILSHEKHDGRVRRDENKGGWGGLNVTLQKNSFCEIWGLSGASEINEPTQHRLCPLITLRRLQRTFTYSSHLSPAA